MDKIEKIVPDTSVIIEGILSEKLRKKEIFAKEILIHEAVIAELEHQANQNKAIGYLGLDEIKRLKDIGDSQFRISGPKPKSSDIRHASLGEIDSMIRQLAWDEDATLLTSDKIQAKVADAIGVKFIYIKPDQVVKKLKLEKFFDDETMSVHLRENFQPYAKKGVPGQWQFVELRKTKLTQDEVQEISREIIEESKFRREGFIEIERPGSTIVQLGRYRIVITKPPFSDGWEITAVRPVRTLTLEDYKLSEKLQKRIAEQAEGILVAGSPGMGKSTFAQALAIYYSEKDKVVKTVEAPRDLVLPDNITQYAISHGDAQEIHDVLLLTRPDYTIFDEMRNTDDFKLFADLRLAGVGMVGVVHATNPIDAIQRFIGRVEMGVIPQIVDTVVFIKNGYINGVLSLKMTVKVPAGMTEADLARPVVIVNDFETGKLVYEIYSYGEQTVVIPVHEAEKKIGVHKLAEKQIEKVMMNYTDEVKVEVISDNKCIVYVPERDIARIIGKQGVNISQIEEKIGMQIDVQEIGKEKTVSEKKLIPHDIKMKNNAIILLMDIKMQHKDIDIYIGQEYVMSAKVGMSGSIKINKKNPMGKRLIGALNNREEIFVYG